VGWLLKGGFVVAAAAAVVVAVMLVAVYSWNLMLRQMADGVDDVVVVGAAG
jgi:hypothetical protein